ncbi:hypothetical protein FB451DRAFT_1372186 [Mycena latifolia]|nr:hypothetical protein FB451DRAFT_1372186 [Mycena latifolia]
MTLTLVIAQCLFDFCVPAQTTASGRKNIQALWVVVAGDFSTRHWTCHPPQTCHSPQTKEEPDQRHFLCSGMEPRRTRQGTQFSPFESLSSPAAFTAAHCQVVETDVDLAALLNSAHHSAAHREELGEDPDDLSEWEEVESRPSTPLSHSLPPSSPQPSENEDLSVLSDLSDIEPLSAAGIDAGAMPPVSAAQRRAARKKEYHKRRRQAKRQEKAASPFTRGAHPKSIPSHRILPPNKSAFDAAALSASGSGAWLGPKPPPPPPRGKAQNAQAKARREAERLKALRLREVDELLKEMGYTYIAWDGQHPLLILDREGRIICVFMGAPEDPEWPTVIAEAIKAMKEALAEGLHIGAFATGDKRHRRGSYDTLSGGYSHGGGQKRPGMLGMPRRQRRLFMKLIKNKYIRCICGLQSSGFRTFGPKMFKQYVNDLEVLIEQIPALQHNFTNSIFPAVTFNLGPESVTFEHLDYHNNPFGCFQSGASSLIPSAIIDHGNTPLGPGETRCSITQYAAGGLFRYVRYGCKTAKELLAQSGGRQMKASLDGAPGERARWGLGLFSKLEDLAADHAASFGTK